MQSPSLFDLLGRSRVRLAAVAVLAALLLGQSLLGDAVNAPRRALFDLYAWAMPRVRRASPPPAADPVLVVAIDEASLQRYHQWPWPRQRVAALVARILDGRPAALGIDILMAEPDRLSPASLKDEQDVLPPALASSLRQLPDQDAALADTLRGEKVALAVAGQRDKGALHPSLMAPVAIVAPPPPAPARWLAALLPALAPLIDRVFADPADIGADLPQFHHYLRSVAVIDAAAAGHGMVALEKDPDGAIRRLPLLASVNRRIVPSLALEMLRLAQGAPGIEVGTGRYAGVRRVAVGGLAIPTRPDGSVWLYLAPDDETTPRPASRFISAAEVLEGKIPAAAFRGSLVLLGLTGAASVDRQTTALGPMTGVELEAQLLEDVVDGRLATRPGWAVPAELGLTLLIGGFYVAALPRMRQRWYPAAILAPLILLAGMGVEAWQARLWLLDVATPAMAGVVVFVTMLAGSLAEADAQRRRLRAALDVQRLRAAKLSGELDAAQRIQQGILPQPSSLPPDPRIEIEAMIQPARHVAGDLYDFFKIDEHRLFVAIGDVSGKGLGASLFMALGKALYKSCALRIPALPQKDEIGAIMRAANAEISRDNVEMLFITLFAGILDLETGLFRFCNAGHDAPLLVRPGEAVRALAGVGGPPLCVVEDFPYAGEAVELRPGDILALATDGVTEAMNEAGEFLGHARVASALAALPPGSGAGAALSALRQAVAGFSAGTEQSDDITILTLRWQGAGRKPVAADLPQDRHAPSAAGVS